MTDTFHVINSAFWFKVESATSCSSASRVPQFLEKIPNLPASLSDLAKRSETPMKFCLSKLIEDGEVIDRETFFIFSLKDGGMPRTFVWQWEQDVFEVKHGDFREAVLCYLIYMGKIALTDAPKAEMTLSNSITDQLEV